MRNTSNPYLRKITLFLAVIGTILTISLPQAGLAFSFNKNNLLNNTDLFNWQSMNEGRIQRFLNTLGGALKDVSGYNAQGERKSAAGLIAEAAAKYRLSPQFYLVLIEKESGLVRARKTASQELIDRALGYGCPGDCDPAYFGFGTQVDSAGNRIQNGYLADMQSRGYTVSGWGVGIPKTTVDGIEITPDNEATAALYTYNPYVGAYGGGDPRWGGNSLFAKIWQEWFSVRYFDGALLRARGEAGIWLIKDGKRHPFHSRSAFYSSYDPEKVIDVDPLVLEAYPIATPIKYPEFSLLQSPDGGVYLLADGKKRPIRSREVFRQLGFNPEELIHVSYDDLSIYPDGDEIKVDSVHPIGVLFQERESGGIVYVENGLRHPIYSKEILRSRFKYQRWTTVSRAELEQYPIGDPVKFKDGEIVTSPGADGVYLITDGVKRGIPSPGVFDQLGLKWSNLIWTTDRALDIHPTGEKITFEVEE
ncbi:MAG: hypothetical protein H6760_01775 [Candidatus Nomurabacteria bacterium]|nr:MAG: hypothetical protein H6760_01775 [Candidatus Nomurabacteria bacterium]